MRTGSIVGAIILIFILVAGGYWYINRDKNENGGAQLANPASVHCVTALGGQLEIVDEAAGQVGYCHLPDGRVCEEWALMRDGSCNAPTAVVSQGIECHDDANYFVVTKGRTETSDVGENILIKHKSTPAQTFTCAYAAAEGDIELVEQGPTYFLGLTRDYLLLDHGTAPPPRGLTVYDLKNRKEIYADMYNRPIEIGDGTFTFWQPVDTKPTAANCPDLAQLKKDGLGAGIERHVKLDLSTLTITNLGETRCSARQ